MVKIVADNMEKVLVDPKIILVGKDGKDGKDGLPGADGLPGKDGLPGRDGKDGRDGIDGKDGKDGTSFWIEYDEKTNELVFKNDGNKKNPKSIKLPSSAKGWGYAAGSGRGGVTAQSDWNQTDKHAVDFIKNKPAIHNVSFKVVDELPAVGNSWTIYLVPNGEEGQSDKYVEWIWVYDDSTQTYSWEELGIEYDLSGLVSDVTVDGTSVVSNGVAVIPNASGSNYGVTKLSNSLTSTSNTSALTPNALNTFAREIATGAPIFDKTLTYAVGDKVRYGTGYYECITAITTAHSWDASEWQQITIQDEIDGKIGYGTSTTSAATVQKEVTISTIKTLNVGQLIIVTPTATSTVANSTLKLNNFDAYPMLYGGVAITTSTDSYVWIKDVPGWWLFDGSNWLFAGHGTDINTTYNSMTLALMIAGENTTNRLISSVTLKDGTFGVVTAYASGDTITPADKYLYNSTSNISALTIVAPSSPDERYMAQINMSSGSTATTLTYPSTFKVLEGCDDVQYIAGVRTFVPVANKRYQIFIENDGVNTVMFAKGV